MLSTGQAPAAPGEFSYGGEPRLGAELPSQLHRLRASGARLLIWTVWGIEVTSAVGVGVVSPCGVQEREVAVTDVAGLRLLPQTEEEGQGFFAVSTHWRQETCVLGRPWRSRGAFIQVLARPAAGRSWLCWRVGRALMDKKKAQGKWEQGIPGWYNSKNSFLFLSLDGSALCTHCRWTMPLRPCESNPNHLQSLASGDCGHGGVTDRQLGHRPVSTVESWGMGVPQIPPRRGCS